MESRQVTLNKLRNLTDTDYVANNKIGCIKILCDITGKGLKEVKDFFEQEWQPYVNGNKTPMKANKSSNNYGTLDHVSIEPDEKPDTLPPPMFLVGHSYKQLDKCVVLILGVSNPNTSYETVYTMGSDGNVIHRYNRRDFGRCTGSDHEDLDPRNLERV